jgi:phosphoribosylanthranilate isomerase
MTVVKICGVMDRETALVALEAGADMLGFVLAPSRRQLSPEAAAEIVHEARRLVPPAERPWLAVGVFANQPLEFVRSAAALAALDVVQLSGQEDPEYSRALNTTVYKTLHLGARGDRDDVGRGFMPRRPGST